MTYLCCGLVLSICSISLNRTIFFVSTMDCLEGWSWVNFHWHFSYHSNPSMWAHVCKNEEIISTFSFCVLVNILVEYDQRLNRHEFLAGTLNVFSYVGDIVMEHVTSSLHHWSRWNCYVRKINIGLLYWTPWKMKRNWKRQIGIAWKNFAYWVA